MSKTIERQVLERALKIMESGWTQGHYAQNERGDPAAYWSKKAVSFCAVGAIYRATMEVTGRRNLRLALKFEEAIDRSLKSPFSCLLVLNDEEGWAAVRRVLRKRLKEL